MKDNNPYIFFNNENGYCVYSSGLRESLYMFLFFIIGFFLCRFLNRKKSIISEPETGQFGKNNENINRTNFISEDAEFFYQ